VLVARAVCVWSNTCNNSCFVLQQQSAVYLELWPSTRKQSWSVSECQRQWRVHWRELSLIHFSCKSNYSILLHNKTPIYSTGGLLRVCVRPARLPVLTWVPSSVPPVNSIRDTFLIGSATDRTVCLLIMLDTLYRITTKNFNFSLQYEIS